VVILAWDPDLTQNDPNHHFWVILGQIVGIVVIWVILGHSGSPPLKPLNRPGSRYELCRLI
jgi:hypothetical protein